MAKLGGFMDKICEKCGAKAVNVGGNLCSPHLDEYRQERRRKAAKIRQDWQDRLKFDYDKVEYLEFDGINHEDYPDYCDAFISSGQYDGRELTDEELDFLNDDGDFVYNNLQDKLY